jgi:hypothetical protein
VDGRRLTQAIDHFHGHGLAAREHHDRPRDCAIADARRWLGA